MPKLKYFTARKLKVGFKLSLDSLHIINANCQLTITPNYLEFGIGIRYINKF